MRENNSIADVGEGRYGFSVGGPTLLPSSVATSLFDRLDMLRLTSLM